MVSWIVSERGTHVLDVKGAGALSSPLVATQFAQLPCWSFHYLVSLGVALVNTVLLIAVFRFKSQDGLFYHDSVVLNAHTTRRMLGPNRTTHRRAE